MVGFSGNATGWQFPRPYATTDSTSHWCVCEFTIGINAPKQQPAAAHVSSTNKLLGEKKLLIEDREQHLSIFRACDAPQQNGLATLTKRVGDGLRVMLERFAKLLRGMIDVGLRKGRKIVKAHGGQGSEQATVGCDDEDTAFERLGGARERFGVGQLSAEVEAGEETKYIAEGRTSTGMESPRQGEHGRWMKEKACTFPVQARRGKHEDARLHSMPRTGGVARAS